MAVVKTESISWPCRGRAETHAGPRRVSSFDSLLVTRAEPCSPFQGPLSLTPATFSLHLALGSALTLGHSFLVSLAAVRRSSRRPSAASVTVPWSCPQSTFSAATPSTNTALRVTQKVMPTAPPASLKTGRSWI